MTMRTTVLTALAATGLLLAGCSLNASPFKTRDQLVATPSVCTPQRFEVYFNEGQARLSDAAREAIGMTAGRLTGCDIRRVQVIGLADATGASGANLTLSQRRAQAVTEALKSTGWPAPAFDVTAAGDEGAATGGVNEPLRRRTEVLVEAAPR